MLRKLYIAASSQHVGKTTTTLGLVAAFRKRGHDMGYCKPVGQETLDLNGLRADKDAHLFKVFPEKMEKVRHYVGGWLAGSELPLLGVLPYEKSLSFPIMQTIMETVQGRVVAHEESLDNRMEDFLSGSLIDDMDKLLHSQNLLPIVSHKRIYSAIRKIQELSLTHGLERSPLSGIILTGDGLQDVPLTDHSRVFAYVHEHRLPVIATALDPLGAVIKISSIEVKINVRTPWKAGCAAELIEKYVDLERLLLKGEEWFSLHFSLFTPLTSSWRGTSRCASRYFSHRWRWPGR